MEDIVRKHVERGETDDPISGERDEAELRVAARPLDLERGPLVAGKASDRVMIIGQAPGAVELTTGLPFSGRAGAELRRWLAEAGIDEAHLPYRTSVTKCFPGKAASGAGDRRPSPPEIALCAPWLEAELALVGPRVVLLDRFWGRVPLSDAVGRRRIDGERVLIPLPHPSGASRWLNAPENRLRLRRALRVVRRAVEVLDNAGSAARMHRST